MPQTCSICIHPQRSKIERMMVAGQPLREIVERYGTAKSILSRHRTHVKAAIGRSAETREMVRTSSLLQSVRIGEERVESLYQSSQEILAGALGDNDRGVAIQAIRATVGVLSEGRNYMTLRGELTGELGRDRLMPSVSIQIICPATGSAELPRISFAEQDAIEGNDVEASELAEIGIRQSH